MCAGGGGREQGGRPRRDGGSRAPLGLCCCSRVRWGLTCSQPAWRLGVEEVSCSGVSWGPAQTVVGYIVREGTIQPAGFFLFFFFAFGYPLQCSYASLVAQMVKNPPAMQETWVQSLGWEDLLKEGMATDSSILAWNGVSKSGTRLSTAHSILLVGLKGADTVRCLPPPQGIAMHSGNQYWKRYPQLRVEPDLREIGLLPNFY